MKIIATLNPEKATEAEIAGYDIREAARAIVYDSNGDIALLDVSKRNYHKLPGGGLEAGEDASAALKRECREEIGCNIEIMGEVGLIIEYRKIFKIKQISYCFLAKVVGIKGEPSFMPDEIEDGFQVQWLPAEEAKKRLLADEPANDRPEINAQRKNYIVVREIVFLDAVGSKPFLSL